MKYRHIAAYVTETPWAILQSKLEEIEGVLEFHMAGGKFTAEELAARFGEPAKPTAGRHGAVAILPLKGVISHRMGGMTEMSGGMSTEKFSGMFRQALADTSVGSILIDVDSPGGTIAGVTELAAEIYAARGQKPITAHVNALCASAAYWIASAADSIVSTPSGSIGAIGVITSHLDTSKAEEAHGVKRTVIAAGKYKAEGHGPLSAEAIEAVRARVNEAYSTMTADIARGRGVKASDVKGGFGEGRVLSAKEALAAGMIDGIATMEATIERMLAGKSSAGMRAENYHTDQSAIGDPIEYGSRENYGAQTITDDSVWFSDDERRRRLERY